MKKLIILILSVSIIKIYAVEDKFSIAVDYYNNKNYTEALIIFDSLINKGYKKSEMYYNIGNCHARLDHLGLAVLYFEKTLLYNPRNVSAKKNLVIQEALVEDDIGGRPVISSLNKLATPKIKSIFLKKSNAISILTKLYSSLGNSN